ncbi:MAG: hypothetical protein N3I35_00785 [Clostridia bacterium]|nr:hypothetical protein [Clostridia bacterium]
MKIYIKPVFECIELRTEERLAGSVCNGTCLVDTVTPDGVVFTAHNNF